jgi:hypothetical protein
MGATSVSVKEWILMSRPPKKHWVEMFDTRIEELEGKISDLEQHMMTLSKIAVFHGQIVAAFWLVGLMSSLTLGPFFRGLLGGWGRGLLGGWGHGLYGPLL